jgi:hypothetical protein
MLGGAAAAALRDATRKRFRLAVGLCARPE